MKVLLVPMNKNKTLTSSDSGRHGPIAHATAASKLFELILQNGMSPYMYTSDAQFGFKASHGKNWPYFLVKTGYKFIRTLNHLFSSAF